MSSSFLPNKQASAMTPRHLQTPVNWMLLMRLHTLIVQQCEAR